MKKRMKKVLLTISMVSTLILAAVGCSTALGDKLNSWACEHRTVKDCKCTECGTEVHTLSQMDEIVATCTEVGYTKGEYCRECRAYSKGIEEIAILDHNYVDCVCVDCGDVSHTYSIMKDCEDCGKGYETEYLKYELMSEGGRAYYEVTGLQTLYIDGEGYRYGDAVTVYIPKTYRGVPVRKIRHGAFSNLDDNENGGVCIHGVYINGHESGLEIGYSAFCHNKFLNVVSLSGNIIFTDNDSYGSYESTIAMMGQFSGCEKLSTVLVDENATITTVLSNGVESVNAEAQVFSNAGDSYVMFNEPVSIKLLGTTFPRLSKGFFGGMAECNVYYPSEMYIPITSVWWLPKDCNGEENVEVVEIKPEEIAAEMSVSSGELTIDRKGKICLEWEINIPWLDYSLSQEIELDYFVMSAETYKRVGLTVETYKNVDSYYESYSNSLDPTTQWCKRKSYGLSGDFGYNGSRGVQNVQLTLGSEWNINYGGLFSEGNSPDSDNYATVRTQMDLVCIPVLNVDGEVYVGKADDGKSAQDMAQEYYDKNYDKLTETDIINLKDRFNITLKTA